MSGQEALGREYFERLYEADEDPWAFATSDYEAGKYERTLAALGDRTYARALELGCSIGVFTEQLALRCGELLAVDISEHAAARARQRLAAVPHVTVVRSDITNNLPPGVFDLIVCSEVLYYLPAERMLDVFARLEASLQPGGSLLAVHWTPPTETYPLRGDEVHELLLANTSLEHAFHEVHPQYVVDRLDRPA